jgi:hypothetical protein
VRTKLGKREHRPGAHDDLLFAAMIALQVHKRTPRDRGPTTPPAERVHSGMKYIGGIDPGVFAGMSEDDEWTS